ncbi:MAG: MarR family transcriptional regulator [Candidatus Sericytochromatia bacterium]|nr:MAG: MarR family transcriptional regulator [Candidatus Sericytochromatia bacterium]
MRKKYPEYIYELEDLLTQIFRNLKENHVKDACNVNLSMPQFICLFIISKIGKMKMSDLASYLSLSYASATNLINRLVEANLVNRYDDPLDRRVVIVELTNKGLELTDTIKEKHRETFYKNCSKLSNKEIKTLIDGLNILVKIIKY